MIIQFLNNHPKQHRPKWKRKTPPGYVFVEWVAAAVEVVHLSFIFSNFTFFFTWFLLFPSHATSARKVIEVGVSRAVTTAGEMGFNLFSHFPAHSCLLSFLILHSKLVCCWAVSWVSRLGFSRGKWKICCTILQKSLNCHFDYATNGGTIIAYGYLIALCNSTRSPLMKSSDSDIKMGENFWGNFSSMDHIFWKYLFRREWKTLLNAVSTAFNTLEKMIYRYRKQMLFRFEFFPPPSFPPFNRVYSKELEKREIEMEIASWNVWIFMFLSFTIGNLSLIYE